MYTVCSSSVLIVTILIVNLLLKAQLQVIYVVLFVVLMASASYAGQQVRCLDPSLFVGESQKQNDVVRFCCGSFFLLFYGYISIFHYMLPSACCANFCRSPAGGAWRFGFWV